LKRKENLETADRIEELCHLEQAHVMFFQGSYMVEAESVVGSHCTPHNRF
jgi:hypothetical protein